VTKRPTVAPVEHNLTINQGDFLKINIECMVIVIIQLDDFCDKRLRELNVVILF
jgi:hypothetical protein